MLKQNTILSVAAPLVMCAPAAFAGQKLDIIQIMGQFVQPRRSGMLFMPDISNF